jgi:hypothetical protein
VDTDGKPGQEYKKQCYDNACPQGIGKMQECGTEFSVWHHHRCEGKDSQDQGQAYQQAIDPFILVCIHGCKFVLKIPFRN